jgi:DNA repair protein RadC
MEKGESNYNTLRRRAIRDWPEAERPREKLIKAGAEALSDSELLAIIIRIGNAGQSAEDLGRELLAQGEDCQVWIGLILKSFSLFQAWE